MSDMDKASDHEKERVERIDHAPVLDHGGKLPSNAIDTTQQDDTVQPTLHLRTWLVLAACSFIWFGVNIGVTATGFWLGPAIADLGFPAAQLWWAEGLLVLQVAVQPFTGLISDFSGAVRKWLACILAVLAGIGFFIAASADSLNPQGIAGACIMGCAIVSYAPTSAIVSDVFPRRYRGIVQGVLYSSVSLGAILASLAGGAFIERGGSGQWRYMIYIGGACMIVGAFLLTICYSPKPVPVLEGDKTFLQKLPGLDWLGCVLYAVATITLLTAIIWGGGQYAWDSAHCIATFVVAGVFFVALLVHQLFLRKENGVFNHRLFENRNFAIALWAIFTEGVVYITLNIFLAVQVSTLYNPSPVILGLHFAVILIVSGCTSLLWGLYSRYTRDMKLPLVVSYLLFIAAFAGMASLKANEEGQRAVWGLCALFGFAFGGPQGLVITVAQLVTPPDLAGLATSHIIGIRSLGGAVGSTIAGAILTPKLTQYLPQYTAEAVIAAGVDPSQVTAVVGAVLTAKAGTVPSIDGVTTAQILAGFQGELNGFAKALSYIWLACLPWSAVAAILLCFMRPLKESMNWHVDRPVERIEDLQGERQI